MSKKKKNARHQEATLKPRGFKSFNLKNTARHLAVLALFSIFAFGIYWNSLKSPFIWDDRYLIAENHFIRSFSYCIEIFKHHLYYSSAGLSNFYRPLQNLVLMADYAIWKENPAGYHITSVLFHILCGFLIYRFIDCIFGRKAIGILVGLLFLVHPVNSTVVDYISSRADSQVTFFILLSLILFLSFLRGGASLIVSIGALTAFILAILSKELGMILPFLLLITIPVFRERYPALEKGAAFKKTTPFFALLAVYVIARATALRFPAPAPVELPSLSIRLLTTFESFARLIKLLFLPVEIHIEKNIPFSAGLQQPSTIVSMLFLGAIGIFAYAAQRYSRMISFGMTWFFISLVPMANIMPINATIADHWLYLPCCGFFMACVGGVADALNRAPTRIRNILKWISLCAYACIIVALSALTIRQNEIWADPIKFYQQALKYSPKSFRAHNEIGIIYLDQDKLDEAIVEFKKAIDLYKEFDQAYDNLGIAYDLKGDYDNAILAHKKALTLNPNNPKIYNNLGNAFNKANRLEEATEAYQGALRLNPGYKAVYNNLGVVYYKRGMFDEARRYWEKVLSIDPHFDMARKNISVMERESRKKIPEPH